MNKRVVITGLGIVSSIGNNKEEVTDSLRLGKSGIRINPDYKALGLRCHLDGPIQINVEELIDRKLRRFMGDAAAYNYIAMQQAISDAELTDREISNPNTGLIVGSGGASHANTVEASKILLEKGVRRVGPYRVTKTMASTTSANLGTAFKIKGISYSISSACATSGHCIGNAYEQILLGNQNVMFAGAAGVNEAIYSILMMKGNFIAASANISEIDPATDGFPIVREIHDNAHLNTLMSNSFGFGGTNCTLVFCRWKD